MEGERASEAMLLRATFYILTKQQEPAMADLTILKENPEVKVNLKVNAPLRELLSTSSNARIQLKTPNRHSLTLPWLWNWTKNMLTFTTTGARWAQNS
jgi:hypothetical protein